VRAPIIQLAAWSELSTLLLRQVEEACAPVARSCRWCLAARLSSTSAPPAHCAAGDIPALRIYVGDTEPTGQASVLNNLLCADYKASAAANASIGAISVNCTSIVSRAVSGRYLIISAPTDPTGRAWMTLCEVEPRIASGGACISARRVRRLPVGRAWRCRSATGA
jgi:hypothetical protein